MYVGVRVFYCFLFSDSFVGERSWVNKVILLLCQFLNVVLISVAPFDVFAITIAASEYDLTRKQSDLT